MKILHTSDWHLGQNFHGFSRLEEQEASLNWLSELIKEREIDCLLVSGDIFHVKNPSNEASKLYFKFLASLINSCCKNIIITAGNHDSPSRIEAQEDLFEYLNIHVVGEIGDNFEKQIIEITSNGEQQLIVAAVPFLQIRDLPNIDSSSFGSDRLAKIKQGIVNHFEKAANLCEQVQKGDTPIVAMGHLFAKSSETVKGEKQDNIYLQDLENIEPSEFPAAFNYVALGHIHKPQRVGKNNHIRYSGSMIPLDFSEIKDTKYVNEVIFDENNSLSVEKIPVPIKRRLKTISGNQIEIQSKLTSLIEVMQPDELEAWVAIEIEDESASITISNIKARFQNTPISILKTTIKNTSQISEFDYDLQKRLEDYTVREIFIEKGKVDKKSPLEMERLLETFEILMDEINENQELEPHHVSIEDNQEIQQSKLN